MSFEFQSTLTQCNPFVAVVVVVVQYSNMHCSAPLISYNNRASDGRRYSICSHRGRYFYWNTSYIETKYFINVVSPSVA